MSGVILMILDDLNPNFKGTTLFDFNISNIANTVLYVIKKDKEAHGVTFGYLIY